MTLTDFLLARIPEIEALAKLSDHAVEAGADLWHVQSLAKRVLAECEAKRRIIEHHLAWEQTLHQQGSDDYTEGEETMYRMAMQWTIRQMVQVYSDHPDYDESWRPE